MGRNEHPKVMTFDTSKCETIIQLGGIRTGSIDYPNPNGGQSCRVAHVNTGSGLSFIVALDRGGDIVDATYKGINLAFLTQNGYKPPNHAYHREYEWLTGWPGGLLTTGGPEYMGEPREEEGTHIPLHGRFSNTPASVEAVINPDPRTKTLEMSIAMTIRDTRMFDPNIEVRRKIICRLGDAAIHIVDEVINTGNRPCSNAMLYHVTLGYPLVDGGSRLICSGRSEGYFQFASAKSTDDFAQVKTIPHRREDLFGDYDARGGMFIAAPPGDQDGLAHVGIINYEQNIGLELTYPISELPRVGNWQYFGEGGSYLAAFEPFSGSIFGTARDDHPAAHLTLCPGESRSYHLSLRVREGQDELQGMQSLDGLLTSSKTLSN